MGSAASVIGLSSRYCRPGGGQFTVARGSLSLSLYTWFEFSSCPVAGQGIRDFAVASVKDVLGLPVPCVRDVLGSKCQGSIRTAPDCVHASPIHPYPRFVKYMPRCRCMHIGHRIVLERGEWDAISKR